MIFVAIDSNDDQENMNIQIDQLYRFQSSPRSLATINEPLYVHAWSDRDFRPSSRSSRFA